MLMMVVMAQKLIEGFGNGKDLMTLVKSINLCITNVNEKVALMVTWGLLFRRVTNHDKG